MGRAAQLEPDSAKYNLALAQVLLQWGHYSTALDFLQAIAPRFGDHLRFEYYIAFSFYGLRRNDQAIAELQKLLQRHPQYAQAYYLLGNCYVALGETHKAAASFKKAIQLKPDRASYYTSLAGVLRQSHSALDQAIAFAKKAVELDPTSSEGKLELALCYEGMNDYADAQKLLEGITRTHPELIPPHRLLAQIYYRSGKISAAKRQSKIIDVLEKQHRKPAPKFNKGPVN